MSTVYKEEHTHVHTLIRKKKKRQQGARVQALDVRACKMVYQSYTLMLLNSYIIQWAIKATTIFCISKLQAYTLLRQHVSRTGPRAHHTTGTYHNSAVLWAAGNDLVVVWAPVYVQHWSCVATYCGVGFVNSTSLKGEREKQIYYVSSRPQSLYVFSERFFPLLPLPQTLSTLPMMTFRSANISQ